VPYRACTATRRRAYSEMPAAPTWIKDGGVGYPGAVEMSEFNYVGFGAVDESKHGGAFDGRQPVIGNHPVLVA